MNIKNVKVNTYRVDPHCENCNAKMVLTGEEVCIVTGIIDYEYKCSDCGIVESCSTKYPKYRYCEEE